MYSPVFSCIPLYFPYSLVFSYILLYSTVFSCIPLYSPVFPCVLLYSPVFPCILLYCLVTAIPCKVYLPTLTPYAWVPRLRLENFDLTPAHACGPISHARLKNVSYCRLAWHNLQKYVNSDPCKERKPRVKYRDYFMESARVRDFHTSWWSIWNRTSERSERVRFLILHQRVWKSRTKRFPCCNLFILYILRFFLFIQL